MAKKNAHKRFSEEALMSEGPELTFDHVPPQPQHLLLSLACCESGGMPLSEQDVMDAIVDLTSHKIVDMDRRESFYGHVLELLSGDEDYDKENFDTGEMDRVVRVSFLEPFRQKHRKEWPDVMVGGESASELFNGEMWLDQADVDLLVKVLREWLKHVGFLVKDIP